jgi:hypothetical protein
MSHHNRYIMYALLGAAASVAGVGGSIYYSFKSWAAARENGRREVLGQLAKFGPNKVRMMCLNIGIRFIEPENGDSNVERALEEELTAEIRAALETELRQSMRGIVESDVRTFLRREVEANAPLIWRLRNEAKELVSKDLKNSSAVRNEVKAEIKWEIRTELTRSGRDVAMVAEAMTDLRAETREALRNEMRSEVRNQLIRELGPEVKESLKNVEQKGITESKAGGYSDDSGSCWTSYSEQTVPASTKKQ